MSINCVDDAGTPCGLRDICPKNGFNFLPDSKIVMMYRRMFEKSEQPEEDQTIKADGGKLRLTLVPMKIIERIAAVRMYGVKKYPDEQGWRKVSSRRYRDALLRHTLSYIAYPDGVDEESGLPHLWHIACNVAFLCEKEAEESNHVEAVPVVHAEWVQDEEHSFGEWLCRCSNCDEEVSCSSEALPTWRYCPGCGAKMDITREETK